MSKLHDIGGGVRLAATVTGSGPPLVLLHGAEGNHRMFDAIVPHLARDFTVIAYDQRDCGETESSEAAATLSDLADDAVALIRAFGRDRAHVYGTSFGGRVAQAIAIRHPRRVDHLVLGSTWPLPLRLEDLNPDGVREIYALRARLPESAEALAAMFLPLAFLDERPELKGIFRTVQPLSARSLRRAATVGDHPALKPGGIRSPTLLLAGELDRVVPAAVTLGMAQEMGQAEPVLLQGLGHAGALQAPELVAGHIRRFCLGIESTNRAGA